MIKVTFMKNDNSDSSGTRASRDMQFTGKDAVNLTAEKRPTPARQQHVPSSHSTPAGTEKPQQLIAAAPPAIGQPLIERRKSPRWLASRLLRMKEVAAICGLSSSSIYKNVRSGTFPQPIKIGLRASAWIKPEVEAWIEQRIGASRR